MIWLLATQRFPPPEFTESGHVLPGLGAPLPRGPWLESLDVAVLLAALALAAWLALRLRSRPGLAVLGIFSVLYFGFWRKGCICSIGSIQNIAQGLADSSFGVPAAVLAFGLAPLAFALLFGRVFCSSVCPHGALQDLVLLRPVTVPPWLEHGLRLVPYSYLGIATIFAAAGGGYLICEYDPFVSIFRLGGSIGIVACGIGLLAIGMFVGRPYCRFLCPYGALLSLASRVSKWRVHVTPTPCSQCRLCEQSCPFNAINLPDINAPSRTVRADKRRLAAMILLLPALLAAGGWLGGEAGKSMARSHRTASLAERVYLEESGGAQGTAHASETFRATGAAAENLYAEARAVRDRYVLAGRLCGAWIALVAGAKLIALAARRKLDGYEADQSRCVACARCFPACPNRASSEVAKAG
ncbi:MAG: 4Fe-4S binding protein [Verrucomicrobiae bacterium]